MKRILTIVALMCAVTFQMNAQMTVEQALKSAEQKAKQEGAPFYGESIEDIRNHQLLVYTDGLNEAENTQHELLGDDRLLELMADAQSLDSHQLIGMMKEAVEQHRNGAEPSDDLTLMCLKLQ